MIRSLQIFCDLIETRSFTKTGQRHGLTQSAVSQHLKSLETQLGCRLINRSPRAMALTDAGRRVHEAAQEILWRFRQLERALATPETEASGTLQVAASLTVGLYELPPYLTEFLRRHPQVDLRVSYLEPPEVYEAVLANRADLGLVAFPDPHAQLIIQRFNKDRLAIIVPPSHPWARLKRLPLKRLNGQPFIALKAGSAMRRAIDRMFERANIRVGILHEFDNIELVKRAVEVRSGLSVVPLRTVATEIQAGTLRALDITDGPADYPVGILTLRHRARTLAAQRLIAALLSPLQPKEFFDRELDAPRPGAARS